MIIRINHTPVDFTLESETTVGDLAQSLRVWASTENSVVVGLLADGKAVLEETTPLAGIETLDVDVVPAGDYDRRRLEVLGQYFELLQNGAAAGDHALLDELKAEYGSVRAASAALLAPLATRLEAAFALLDGWTSGLVEASAAIRLAVQDRLAELKDPDAALDETLQAVENALPALAEVSGLFQQGHDKEAFDRILGLFLLLEDAARRADLRGGDLEAWTAFQNEWQPLLKETEAALAAGDYVLLSDLLEYELTPRLADLRSHFPNLPKLDRV